MSEKQEQWYSNKDLKEMLDGLRDDMKDTRHEIRKYNNLVSKLSNAEQYIASIDNRLEKQRKLCEEVQTRKETKSDIYQNLLKLWPILLSTIIFLLTYFNLI